MVSHGISEKFQSTLPRRERHSIWTSFYIVVIFQSTLPRRERHIIIFFLFHLIQFQSTLPRRERLRIRCTSNSKRINFNPHSHEGSDYYNFQTELHDTISIHTPTKGATDCCLYGYYYKEISIHTPTKGATL